MLGSTVNSDDCDDGNSTAMLGDDDGVLELANGRTAGALLGSSVINGDDGDGLACSTATEGVNVLIGSEDKTADKGD